MPIWPAEVDIRKQDWATENVVPNGVAFGDLMLALVPALRALFLLGYRAMSVNVTDSGEPGEEEPTSVSWTSIDMETLERSTRTLRLPRPQAKLNVAFELEEFSDTGLDAEGFGFGMPLPPLRLGTTVTVPAPTALQQFKDSVSSFVTAAVTALVPKLSTGTAKPTPIGVPELTRSDAAGLAWLFDPEYWRGFEADVTASMKSLVWSMAKNPARVLTGQVTGLRGPGPLPAHPDTPEELPEGTATLDWLFIAVAGDDTGLGNFSMSLNGHLQARGASHLLSHTASDKLFWDDSAFDRVWLDVLAELVWLGVVDTEGMLEPLEPDEPLVVVDLSPVAVDLHIWNEATIHLKRLVTVNGAATVRGSAAWEYIRGDSTSKATLVIVAGRGIEISKKPSRVDRWDLAVFRVQKDVLVPEQSEAVNPWSFMSSDLVGLSPPDPDIENPASLLTRPLPDGLHLEFPVFGGVEPPPDDEVVDDNKPLPFCVRLTVDPHSAWDWYTVDVSFYEYDYSYGLDHHPANVERRTAAHLVVWATPTVVITCSDRPDDDTGPLGADNGAEASHDPLGTNPIERPWQVSAEFWVTEMNDFPEPWATQLPVTFALVAGLGSPSDEGAPTLDVTPGTDLVAWTSADGTLDVLLQRAVYQQATFDRHAGQLLDIVNMVIGFIPIIGDIVDVAETAYAWQTGYDRWGRPVSDFQLALMTLFSAVPFVSGSFARSVSSWVDTRPDAMLREGPLSKMFFRAASGFDLAQSDLEEVLSAAYTFARSESKAKLVAELGEFVADNPDIVSRYVVRITLDGGSEWLSLADVTHPTRAGFRVNLLDDAFARFRRTNPGATEEDFLHSGLTGQQRILAESLLGPEAVYLRSIPRPQPEPFVAYHPVPGATLTVTEIVATGTVQRLIDTSGDIARAVIDTPSSMRIQTLGHGGHVADAAALIDLDAGRIGNRIAAQLDHVSGGNPTRVTAVQLSEVVGADLLGKRRVTMHDRAYRWVEGNVVAEYEVLLIADDTSILDNPSMMEPLIAFLRGYIGRPRFPWGVRGELRSAATIVQGFADEPRVVLRTQQSMPDLRGGQLRAGADHGIYVDTGEPLARCYPAQVKVISDLNQASIGRVRLVIDGNGRVIGVKGPNIIAQVIRDEFRRLPWNGYLPPASMGRPPLVAPPDPLSAGWVRDAGVRFVILDDEFIAAQLLQRLYDTARNTRTAGRSVNLRYLDVSPGLRTTVEDGFTALGRDPTRLNLREIEQVRADIQDVIVPAMAADIEDDIARNLLLHKALLSSDPEFVPPRVIVVRTSEGTAPMRNAIFSPDAPETPEVP